MSSAMSNVVLFVHVSLDGFVAGPNGEMDWISAPEELFDFVGQRVNDVQTALYGRATYQMMQDYWPTAADQPDASRHDIEHSRWYASVTKVVMSRTMSADNAGGARVIGADLYREIGELRRERDGEIVMFGSPTAAHALMAEDLIDGYWLFVNPVVLGAGIPLFERPAVVSKLRLLDTHTFDCGVVSLNYVRATE